MSQFHAVQPPLEVDHPKCPHCGARMWLARIEPEKMGHDKRTFECPECETIFVEVIKYK